MASSGPTLTGPPLIIPLLLLVWPERTPCAEDLLPAPQAREILGLFFFTIFSDTVIDGKWQVPELLTVLPEGRGIFCPVTSDQQIPGLKAKAAAAALEPLRWCQGAGCVIVQCLGLFIVKGAFVNGHCAVLCGCGIWHWIKQSVACARCTVQLF